MGLESEEISRKTFLSTSAMLAAGALTMPDVLAAAAASSRTLVYVDSDTPPSFDLDQTGTQLTEQIASMSYGGDIVRYKIISDKSAHVLRADIFPPGRQGIDNGVAEAIDISHDQRVFTFHLRRDVKSALGNPLTAEDVIWSFK